MRHNLTLYLAQIIQNPHRNIKLITIFAATLIVMQLLTTTLAPSSQAATAPENCYDFEPLTGTIVSYSDAPECPKDLEIPSIINGNEVVRIGEYAFSSLGLTSVTFPNTIIEIARAAFGDNQLTSLELPNSLEVITFQSFAGNELRSVYIPDSVTTIESESFTGNLLTSLDIPASVTSIGGDEAAFVHNLIKTVTIRGNPTLGSYEFLYNGTPDYSADERLNYDPIYYRDNAEFVRILATDPSFIASNFDRMDVGDIYNEDGTEIVGRTIIGGVLINPASLLVNYVNSSNSNLLPQQRIIGPNPMVTDYSVRAALEYITIPDTGYIASLNEPTIYNRIGQSITPPLPAISGYVTPKINPISLVDQTNQASLTYFTQAEVDGGATSNPDGTPNVPNTGLRALLLNPILVVAGGSVATLALIILRQNRNASTKN